MRCPHPDRGRRKQRRGKGAGFVYRVSPAATLRWEKVSSVREEANRVAVHFSRAEIFYSTWSLSERPGVGRVRASRSHWCCTPFVPTARQTDCRTCHCGYWLACLLFCSISSGGGRVSVPAALSFLLQHRDSQAQRKICWSSSVIICC